jgi:AcrR family transcriptional regulator
MVKWASASKEKSISTKEDILKKARKLFAKDGFEGVSIRAISDKATCNVSAISYHFGNKEELYRACLKEEGMNIMTLFKSILLPPVDRADLEAKLRLFLGQFYEYSLNNRELILILAKDISSKITHECMQSNFDHIPSTITIFFKQAQDKGIIRASLDSGTIAELLCNSVFMNVLFADFNKTYKKKNLADSTYRQELIEKQISILRSGLFEESL